MREERGKISGDIVIAEPFTLWGALAGNLSVVKGGKFYLRGSIYGNVRAEEGGRAHLLGNVSGDVIVEEDAKVILGGAVGGDCVNHGGRLYIEHTARILGKVKRKKGKTEVLPAPGQKIEQEHTTYNITDED